MITLQKASNLKYDIACIYPRPCMNGLVTGGNTKLGFRGFVLSLFQSTTAYKIDSDIPKTIRSYSRYEKTKILQVTVNKVEVLHLLV